MINLLPAALVLFLIASLLKVSFIYIASYLLFAVYLLATFWSRRNLDDLRFRRTFPERALLGDDVEVVLEVENRGLLPVPWVEFHDRLPVALTSPPFFRALISLQPRETRRFTYTLHCRQRGWYLVGPLTASLGDVFGFSRREREFSSARHLTVYPKVLPLDELGLPSKSPFGHLRTRQPLYEDPARVVGVREYQSGDSLRLVNWKASASAGQLQVRKLEPAMTLETVILLDLDLSAYERDHAYNGSELAIVVAASVASHLVGLRQEIGLLTNGLDPAEEVGSNETEGLIGFLPGKGRAQLLGILELLGRLAVPPQRAFWPRVRREVGRLPWGATLVFVVPSETEELIETILPLRRSGYNVVLIYVDYPSAASGEAARRRAELLGATVYRIFREDDVEIWRRQVAPTGAGHVQA